MDEPAPSWRLARGSLSRRAGGQLTILSECPDRISVAALGVVSIRDAISNLCSILWSCGDLAGSGPGPADRGAAAAVRGAARRRPGNDPGGGRQRRALLRADGTRIWSLMQLERQLRPEAYGRRRGGYLDRRRTRLPMANNPGVGADAIRREVLGRLRPSCRQISCMPCHPPHFTKPSVASPGTTSIVPSQAAGRGAVVRREATCGSAADNLLTVGGPQSDPNSPWTFERSARRRALQGG